MTRFLFWADAFNDLLGSATDSVRNKRLGKAIIFVIDGTDRLGRTDAPDFFVRDIHQMRQIRTNVIYCAPISVLTEEGQLMPNYDETPFRLPMIKLAEKGSDDRIEASWSALREFVSLRMPLKHFDDQATLDLMIAASGGHLRDLLRLVSLCFQELDEGPIAHAHAETAINRLATEYRRVINTGDFSVITEIDLADADFAPVNDTTRRLLYDLVLLEYNAYWWQSHPAIRTLPQYREALEQAQRDGAGAA